MVKRYTETPDFVKRRAMEIYAEHGPAIAARRLKVNRKTIDRWRRELGIPSKRLQPLTQEEIQRTIKSIDRRRLDMRGTLLDKIRMMLSDMDSGKKPAELKDLASAVGTLIDKFRLEAGEATSHTIKQTVGDDNMSPKDKMALLREIRDVAGNDRTIEATPNRVEDKPA